jgi:hypothetical protein
MTKRNKIGLLCLLLFVLITETISYSGLSMYARFWHLSHGNFTTCGGFTIPVPSGWWAKEDGCRLVTPLQMHNIELQHPVLIIFNATPTPSAQDNRSKQDVLNRLQRDGAAIYGTVDLTVAGSDTLCFEHSLPEQDNYRSVVSCNLDERMVVNLFYDDPKWKTDFYQILRGIR